MLSVRTLSSVVVVLLEGSLTVHFRHANLSHQTFFSKRKTALSESIDVHLSDFALAQC